MDLGAWTARWMGMNDGVWRRHANPWSFWTRLPIMPALTLSLWSREWIGWWALFPVTLVVVWVWLNPRAFPPPRSTRTWMSRATFGERIWLNRQSRPIPSHHRLMAGVLAAASCIGGIIWAWGIIALSPWPTVFGIAVVVGAKLWFLDRMVWLFEDMKDRDPEATSWLR